MARTVLGWLPAMNRSGVFRDETLAVLRHGLRQDRVNCQLLALRVGVVVQDRDGHDVVDADVHLVGLGLGCFHHGGGGNGNHRDASGGGLRAVGHRVFEQEGILGAGDVGDPQDAVVDHADRRRGVLRAPSTDCRTRTPPDGSESLASGSSSTLPPAGMSADVVDGDGISGVLAGFHVHPDQALAALRPVAGDVRQVDRPRGGAAEREGAAVGDGAEFRGTVGLHLGQAERAAVGVDVVLQRRNRPGPGPPPP